MHVTNLLQLVCGSCVPACADVTLCSSQCDMSQTLPNVASKTMQAQPIEWRAGQLLYNELEALQGISAAESEAAQRYECLVCSLKELVFKRAHGGRDWTAVMAEWDFEQEQENQRRHAASCPRHAAQPCTCNYPGAPMWQSEATMGRGKGNSKSGSAGNLQWAPSRCTCKGDCYCEEFEPVAKQPKWPAEYSVHNSIVDLHNVYEHHSFILLLFKCTLKLCVSFCL